MKRLRRGRLPPGRRGLKRAWLVIRRVVLVSPSPRKAWIETPRADPAGAVFWRRLPPGRRGLKHRCFWCAAQWQNGRLPPGRRGLKRCGRRRSRVQCSRLPPGRRGLKRFQDSAAPARRASPSPRKAWIETSQYGASAVVPVSPSPRKAWIETYRALVQALGRLGRLPPGRRGLKR